MKEACKHLIVPFDKNLSQPFFKFENNTSLREMDCPWSRGLFYRPSTERYPAIRSMARCVKPHADYVESGYKTIDGFEPIPAPCKAISRLEPVLVKSRETQLWEFKLEPILIACSAQVNVISDEFVSS
jgi:hypothetical protein